MSALLQVLSSQIVNYEQHKVQFNQFSIEEYNNVLVNFISKSREQQTHSK